MRNLPRVFFRFTFSIDLFISPNSFKNWFNVNSAHRCLFEVYTKSTALGLGPVQSWQQEYSNNVSYVVFRFWLTLGWSLHYFLALLLLTLNILCLLWMSLNATLWHIFVKHQIDIVLMGVVAKHKFATVPMISPMECSSQIFVWKLLWRRNFSFLSFHFITVPIWKTCSMSLMRFNIRIFHISFYFIAVFK